MLGSTIALYILSFYFNKGFNLYTFAALPMFIQLTASLTFVIISFSRYYAGLKYQFLLVMAALFTVLVFVATMILLGFSEPDIAASELAEEVIVVFIALVWVGSAVYYLNKAVAAM